MKKIIYQTIFMQNSVEDWTMLKHCGSISSIEQKAAYLPDAGGCSWYLVNLGSIIWKLFGPT